MTVVARRNRRPRSASGFTMVELVATMSVILVVSAIAMPSFISAYHAYQVSDAATQLAGILQATRLDAIRRNTPVNCIIQQAAGVTNIWVDSINNSTEDPGEKQIVFNGAANLVDAASVPGTATLTAAVGVPTLTNVSVSNATLGFDQRGAGDPNSVYALYIGNTNATDAGYRAVILFPSGSLQTWQADPQGNWRFLK
jgi:prepilin-type N-terminal cleavage/methylation domain-containing protein